MGYLTALALALASCQAAPAPQDAAETVRRLVAATRAQGSYETKFKAKLAPPAGDAIEYDGACVWLRPGVVFIRYTATGGDLKMGVRTDADHAWIHNSLAGWVTAEESGLTGFGRGLQNPDEILAVLADPAGSARLLEPGAVRVDLSGDDMMRIMRGQAQEGAFDWAKSAASIVLREDGERRLKQFTVQATLVSTDPDVGGKVAYEATVDVVAYGGAKALTFLDEDGREIPLLKDIQDAIDKETK